MSFMHSWSCHLTCISSCSSLSLVFFFSFHFPLKMVTLRKRKKTQISTIRFLSSTLKNVWNVERPNENIVKTRGVLACFTEISQLLDILKKKNYTISHDQQSIIFKLRIHFGQSALRNDCKCMRVCIGDPLRRQTTSKCKMQRHSFKLRFIKLFFWTAHSAINNDYLHMIHVASSFIKL